MPCSVQNDVTAPRGGSSGHSEIAKRTRGSTGSTPLIHPSERQKCHHQEPRKCHRCPETELSPMSRDITKSRPCTKVCTLCTPPSAGQIPDERRLPGPARANRASGQRRSIRTNPDSRQQLPVSPSLRCLSGPPDNYRVSIKHCGTLGPWQYQQLETRAFRKRSNGPSWTGSLTAPTLRACGSWSSSWPRSSA